MRCECRDGRRAVHSSGSGILWQATLALAVCCILLVCCGALVPRGSRADDSTGEPAPALYLDRADSSARRHLEQAQSYLADGQWDEAIESLRQVAENHGGQVIEVAPGRYQSVRDYCHAQFAALPAEALELYRGRVDPQARQWVEAGTVQRDQRLLASVVEQAFCSTYGDDALLALGELALERGAYAAAREHWLALFGDLLAPSIDDAPLAARLVYPDSDVPRADVAARLILVSLLEGDLERAAAEIAVFRQRYGDATGRLAGRTVEYVPMLTSLLDSSRQWPAPAASGDWLTFAGAPTRTRVLPETIDVGALEWRQPLARVQFDPTLSLGLRMPLRRVAEGHDPLLSYHPLVWNGLVLLNNSEQILALDVATGEPPWNLATPVIFRDGPSDTGRLGSARMGTGVPRYTMTIAGARLYARMGSPVTSRAGDLPRSGQPGYVVCLDLAAEGRLLWKLTPPDERWSFEGSPLADDQHVYIVMRRSEVQPQVYVACFDAQTGQPRWNQFVCAGQSPWRGQLDETTHNLLTRVDDTLFVNTNLGAVAALDAGNGSLKWVTLYRRAADLTLGRQAAHLFRDLNPCVYDRGLLLVAPSDSESILALDAHTGRPRWDSALAPDVVHLLGVSNGYLLASGQRLYWFDLAKEGKIHYRWPDSDLGLGYGRGILAGGQVYWPSREQIHVFDVASTRKVRVIDLMAQHGVPGGNLVAAEGFLLVASGDSLAGFSQYSRLRERLERQVALAPDDPLLRLELAQCAEALGDRALALAHYRAALALTAALLDDPSAPDARDSQDAAATAERAASLVEAAANDPVATSAGGTLEQGAPGTLEPSPILTSIASNTPNASNTPGGGNAADAGDAPLVATELRERAQAAATQLFELLLDEATRVLDAQQPDEAIELLDEAAALLVAPEQHVTALLRRAEAHLAHNQPRQAVADFQRILADPLTAAALIEVDEQHQVRAARLATRSIRDAIARWGRDVYAPFDMAAALAYPAACQQEGSDGLIELIREFPSAAIATIIRREIAARHGARQQPAAAARWLASAAQGAVDPAEQAAAWIDAAIAYEQLGDFVAAGRAWRAAATSGADRPLDSMAAWRALIEAETASQPADTAAAPAARDTQATDTAATHAANETRETHDLRESRERLTVADWVDARLAALRVPVPGLRSQRTAAAPHVAAIQLDEPTDDASLDGAPDPAPVAALPDAAFPDAALRESAPPDTPPDGAQAVVAHAATGAPTASLGLLAHGQLYSQDGDDGLVALDAPGGAAHWRYRIPRGSKIAWLAASGDDLVIELGAHPLAAASRPSQRFVWLAAADGSPRGEYRGHSPRPAASRAVSGAGYLALVDDEPLDHHRRRCRVTLLEAPLGQVVWRRQFEAPAGGPAPSCTFVDDYLLLAISDAGLLALRSDDGSLAWHEPLQSQHGNMPGLADALAGDEAAVYYVDEGYLHARQLADGRHLWRQPLGQDGAWHVVRQRGWVIAASALLDENGAGRIVVVDAAQGTVLAEVALEGPPGPTRRHASPAGWTIAAGRRLWVVQ